MSRWCGRLFLRSLGDFDDYSMGWLLSLFHYSDVGSDHLFFLRCLDLHDRLSRFHFDCGSDKRLLLLVALLVRLLLLGLLVIN